MVKFFMRKKVNMNSTRKEVTKMKKLIVMIAAVAMIFSFLPKAEATGAQLGVTVTFNLGYPEQIEVLAKAVYHHAFDINGDGIVDEKDYMFVKDTYLIAEEYQVYLPGDIFAILDVNGDGVITCDGSAGAGCDVYLVCQEVRVYWIASDFRMLRGRADEIYNDAVNSGDPDVIQLAITHLREYHGDEIKPRIAELQEIAEERLDLHELIDEVLEKGFGLLQRIDDYIMRLTSMLYPLKIGADPQGPFKIMEGDELQFSVYASDEDTVRVYLAPDDDTMPEGANWEEIPLDTQQAAQGIFSWIPQLGQAQEDVYRVRFVAKNEEGEMKDLVVEITVTPARISIEVRPPTWDLTGVRLGAVIENVAPDGYIMHEVINTGDVDVMLDIAYAPYVQEGIVPGETQGTNTFTTAIADESNILLPGKWLTVGRIPEDSVQQLHVFYGAPEKVSEGITKHSVTYDLRATGDVN